MAKKAFYSYKPDGVTVESSLAAGIKALYAPLCGQDAHGLKSAITPHLSGDIKLDKFHYVTKPASREDLRQPLREFFVFIKGKGVVSLSQGNADSKATVTVGQIWHQLNRRHPKSGIELTAVNFIPVNSSNMELMQVKVKNISKKPVTITPTAAIPIFGRSLANKHDHEHVTALLNRIEQNAQGVLVSPTMAFNEEGHKTSSCVYFVYGCDDKNQGPVGSFPTVDSFYGDGGSLAAPDAVISNHAPKQLTDAQIQGKEAVGALRFKSVVLKAGQEKSYIIAVGFAADASAAQKVFQSVSNVKTFAACLDDTRQFWAKKISVIDFKTGDAAFNAWSRWVTLQPVLRRIFGCSFLPDHDYGKGGKGWRDIWQDLLSLILIEPQTVRATLINNCGGVRIDGSNATIIGTNAGEFIADRNAITRVWMDHGVWPWLTLLLYIDQTGDADILFEKQTYFRDPQLSRTYEKDIGWMASYGHSLLDKKGHGYHGTILEHVLVQHLTQFFNVGAHNIIRLESADWNDGLDMAFAKGESVAFTSFYAGNLMAIADVLEKVSAKRNIDKITIAKEILHLLDSIGAHSINYDHAQEKRDRLFGTYCSSVQPSISGEKVEVSVADIAKDLRHKASWIFNHLRHHEMVSVKEKAQTYRWFNGYYDNKSQRVEGSHANGVRMTLTGQVFAIMSGMAHDDEVKDVINSVDRFLKDKNLGGYRLNTDFGVPHYLDLGRAFGFAYGTKENGAFFSHMIVMYAYALYHRGFARQGHEVLKSVYNMAIDTDRSKIYPGVPEYFDSEGRGMYHYLTGSASWFILTQLVQVFGVRGSQGDLVLAPQLVKEQFDQKGLAAVSCQFAGKRITVEYVNPKKLDAGAYKITKVTVKGANLVFERLKDAAVQIKRAAIAQDMTIQVVLA